MTAEVSLGEFLLVMLICAVCGGVAGWGLRAMFGTAPPEIQIGHEVLACRFANALGGRKGERFLWHWYCKRLTAAEAMQFGNWLEMREGSGLNNDEPGVPTANDPLGQSPHPWAARLGEFARRL